MAAVSGVLGPQRSFQGGKYTSRLEVWSVTTLPPTAQEAEVPVQRSLWQQQHPHQLRTGLHWLADALVLQQQYTATSAHQSKNANVRAIAQRKQRQCPETL